MCLEGILDVNNNKTPGIDVIHKTLWEGNWRLVVFGVSEMNLKGSLFSRFFLVSIDNWMYGDINRRNNEHKHFIKTSVFLWRMLVDCILLAALTRLVRRRGEVFIFRVGPGVCCTLCTAVPAASWVQPSPALLQTDTDTPRYCYCYRHDSEYSSLQLSGTQQHCTVSRLLLLHIVYKISWDLIW